VGERLRLHASLRRTRSFANPRGYDYAAALARRGVWVTAFASGTSVERVAQAPLRRRRLAAARQRIGQLIDGALLPQDAALLRALVIGDEAAVPAELWNEVAAAGLAHLLSVSGLHIAFVWGIAFAVAYWALSRSERLLLHFHVRAIAACAALAPAVGYAALAGLSVPVVRSTTMTALFVACLAVGREVKPLRVLCLTAALIALLRPGTPLDASFQLSFVSVLSLILAGEAWSRRRGRQSKPGRRQRLCQAVVLACIAPAAALIGTAPLVALHFNRWTPIGLLTNPILVPLAGTPATALGLAGAAASIFSESLAQSVFAVARWPLGVFRFGVAWASSWPLASVRVPTPTVLEIALVYALLALPWLPAPRRRAAAGLLSLAMVVDLGWWAHERWLRSDLRVRFLDVGQGDAAVVEMPRGKVMVIDGGGFARSRFDVGERVIAPYLWSRKILRIDYLVASHGDWDHQGGLHYLARAFAPRELWISRSPKGRMRLARLEQEVRREGGIVRRLAAGEAAAAVGALDVDCLHPPPQGDLSANDSSLVLRLRLGRTSILFTGDVEAPAEAVLTQGPTPEPVTVLKVPHHGSATSSGEGLLRWARPEIAVVSVGSGNGYGLPHPSVLRRYERFGARCLCTDRDGSVLVVSAGELAIVRSRGDSYPQFCSLLGVLC